jgi:hypothetical protein
VLLEKLAQLGAGGPVEEDLEGDDGDGRRDQLAAAPDPGKTRRILGIVSGTAGLAAIGISSYVVMSARSDYREAKAAHCNAMNQCDAVGLEITRDARSKANIGTVLFIGGSVLVAGGVILYLTAPERRIGETRDGGGDDGEGEGEEEALRWTPVITPESAGFVIAGSF